MLRRFFVPACTLAAVMGLLLHQAYTIAQESKSAQKSPPAKTADAEQVRAAYEAKLTEWKNGFKTLRQLQHDFQVAKEGEHQKLADQWDQTMARMWIILDELTDAAIAAYEVAPGDDRELQVWLAKILKDHVDHDRYEKAVVLADVLIAHGCDDPEVFKQAGQANFSLQKFQRTVELLDKAIEVNALAGDETALRTSVDEIQKLWEKELEIRAKEAEADDLPRVKFTTTKGEVIVELFENEAPGTVGNFISLVRSGFYDGLTFHRVVSGFMAQGGCPKGDGSEGPGYQIYDECKEPNARMHFRGTLSMAKTVAPNSGGSQFFITYSPTPQLNNLHTVFGRVIEGMDVVTKFRRRDADQEKNPPEGEKIIKAEVIRDRGHDNYLPNKVN